MTLYAGHISWAYIILLCKLGEICSNELCITMRVFVCLLVNQNWISVIPEKGTEERSMRFSHTGYYNFHLQHGNYLQRYANRGRMGSNQAVPINFPVSLGNVTAGSPLTFPGPQYSHFSDSSVINTLRFFNILLALTPPFAVLPVITCMIL